MIQNEIDMVTHDLTSMQVAKQLVFAFSYKMEMVKVIHYPQDSARLPGLIRTSLFKFYEAKEVHNGDRIGLYISEAFPIQIPRFLTGKAACFVIRPKHSQIRQIQKFLLEELPQ